MAEVTAYANLERQLARLSDVNGAAGILHWDAATMMPEGAAEARGDVKRLRADGAGRAEDGER